MIQFNKIKIAFWILLSFTLFFNSTCKNKKPVRKLIGEWEVINSTLTIKNSNAPSKFNATLGTLFLSKNKSKKVDFNSNDGSWNFVNFLDSIIPAFGNLLWKSLDKDNYVKIPWNLKIIFSTEITKGDPNRGGDFFDCYQGTFIVTELKKNNHYLIEGDIFKPMNDPNKIGHPTYKWIFEIKEK